jgi:hypothetical protein
MKLLLISACAVLSACANNLPMDPSKMTPEQLKASRESSIVAQCTTVNGPWGKGITTYASFDKSVLYAGSVTLDSECKIGVTADPKPSNRPASSP